MCSMIFDMMSCHSGIGKWHVMPNGMPLSYALIAMGIGKWHHVTWHAEGHVPYALFAMSYALLAMSCAIFADLHVTCHVIWPPCHHGMPFSKNGMPCHAMSFADARMANAMSIGHLTVKLVIWRIFMSKIRFCHVTKLFDTFLGICHGTWHYLALMGMCHSANGTCHWKMACHRRIMTYCQYLFDSDLIGKYHIKKFSWYLNDSIPAFFSDFFI